MFQQYLGDRSHPTLEAAEGERQIERRWNDEENFGAVRVGLDE